MKVDWSKAIEGVPMKSVRDIGLPLRRKSRPGPRANKGENQ
jgi:hypothetical protein